MTIGATLRDFAAIERDKGGGRRLSEALNRGCACITLDREALYAALDAAADDKAFVTELIATRPHLVSNAPAFLAGADVEEMLGVARAIEAAARLPRYRAEALAGADEIARVDHGPIGAFMGYDFHVTPEGPRLIEINTNAGGAFLNAFIGRAQRACCEAIAPALRRPALDAFEDDVFAMFVSEWLRQGRSGAPARVAIVDDAPTGQYLYPEFILARKFFEARGIEAVIADAAALAYDGEELLADGRPVDLVYNRLVDFSLARPEHGALRAAYRDGAAVVTPGPRHHALLADKRNLALFSDAERLRAFGLADNHVAALAAVPETVLVDAGNAPALWEARKQYFFKPTAGYGGKAVYRGDKLTKSTWSEIVKGGYVAQALAAPGARTIDDADGKRELKLDVRLYTYAGRLLLAAARLYQGQTTNFRTPGGGFAPVFVV
jgi:hypothetical protein